MFLQIEFKIICIVLVCLTGSYYIKVLYFCRGVRIIEDPTQCFDVTMEVLQEFYKLRKESASLVTKIPDSELQAAAMDQIAVRQHITIFTIYTGSNFKYSVNRKSEANPYFML